jgi:sec-independent protein translocase protein TatC
MSETDKPRPILEHINELRRRLLIALASLVLTVGLSFVFTDKLIIVLTAPVGGLQALQSIDVTENLGVYMRVALLTGFILDFPIIIYELLRFILPGLNAKEKRFVAFSIPVTTVFFLGGVLFAFFVMLPAALPFLMKFLGVTTVPRLSSYISFVTNLLFWIGISFETPLFLFILAKFNIVTAKTLLKGWRYAIVIIAILAAVITPTVDPVNMGLLMLPLIALYFISILFAFLARSK